MPNVLVLVLASGFSFAAAAAAAAASHNEEKMSPNNFFENEFSEKRKRPRCDQGGGYCSA